ncbi:MAG: nucleotidyltransferase domain-containing protein [Trueperaceae bacterium]|nr:nucleotidyltransferase domain-containing protein [Trueperaceae bacterium]
MPVTSSRSSIKRWPSAEQVLGAATVWAKEFAAANDGVVAVGYFGSYAVGEAGVGSDLDLIVIRRDDAPVPDLLGADVAALPVPTDILHYTEGEFSAMLERGGKMARVARHETAWLIGGI